MILCSHTLEWTVQPINQMDFFFFGAQLHFCGLQSRVVNSEACLKCVTLRGFGVYAQCSLYCVDSSFLCACMIFLGHQHNRLLVLSPN